MWSQAATVLKPCIWWASMPPMLVPRPSGRKRQAADILADMFFHSRFAEEDVVNELGVVLEEIDMYRDTPEDLVAEQLLKTVVPGALGRPVLGKPSTLAKMTGESLRDFKERQYRPDRVVVSLCGSFAEAHIAHLSELFSALPTGKRSAVSRCRRSSRTPSAPMRKPIAKNSA